MKRILFFLSAILITSVTLFTSCTEDTDPVDLPPTVNFVADAGYISNDATLTVGMPFAVKVLAQANVTSGSKIQSIKITRIVNNQIIWDTTLAFNDATVTLEANFNALNTVGTENIEFKATDKAGQSAKKEIKITTTNVSGGAINSWEMRILGSWNNLTVGSSFASINGNVYMLDQAFANQNLIDFIYWWGQTTAATIGAPNDPNAALVFNTGAYALSNWTTRNATKFKPTTLTSAQFDAVTDATPCIDNATGADGTRLGALAVDQVFAFISVTGKHGLIRVKNITEGSAGQITIDVKVQQ
jgi:hypothetical protein